MKVKCRGYKGELIELSAIAEGRRLSGEYKVLAYKVRIALNNANLTIENVRNNEIEFVKEQ